MSVPSESLWAKTDAPRASATLNSRLQLRLLRHSSSTDKRSRVVHVGLTSHPTKSQHSVAAVVAASVTVEAVVASEAVTAEVSAVASEVAIVAASEVAIVAASEVVTVAASEVETVDVVASEVEIAAASEVETVVVAETSAMLSTRTRATSLLTLARRLPSELSDSGDKAVVKVQ